MSKRVILISVLLMCRLPVALAAERPVSRVEGVYISTGDSHFLGGSLPVDSRASIEAAFDMLKHVFGIKRIYWRGLQEAAWMEVMHVREENFRSASFHHWSHQLLREHDLEKLAVQIAHAKGLELWGVGTLGDWGATPETPSFTQFPMSAEARFRIEHPEWAPVDKYGYRRQGGPVELAYPDARDALVDVHTRLTRAAGYDGIIFLSYVENFSTRFPDEFGYSDPIVDEFERRYGVNIRKHDFTRYASRADWYRLRGEYLTQYLRELKAALAPDGTKLGMFVNPRTPRMPGLWATLPHTYFTIGKLYFDLDTWVEDDIVDLLAIYGGSSRAVQAKTVRDCLWMTRDTDVSVSFVTTGLTDPVWQPIFARGLGAIYAAGEDQHYLLRSRIPAQTAEALTSGTLYEQMRFLSQVIDGEATVASAAVIPFAAHENMLMRRLAVFALGRLKDPAALPVIEAALTDSENGVRCKAMQALRDVHRPESTARIIDCLAQFGNHPLGEMARDTIPRLRPFPREELTEAALNHGSADVRRAIIRAFGRGPATADDLPLLKQALNDSDRYVRAAAIRTLGTVRNCPEAVELIVEALNHDDVAMSNRAVDALENTIKRRDRDTLELRPRMLQAAVGLFRKMGDGCKRADRDWGYRSAGNALLAFGDDGEAALRDFMDQSADKRLAELAWRVLYFREKAGDNKFNIITEKENEEAFKARPAWLKTIEIERIAQDFESDRTFGGSVSGSVGDVHSIPARWNHFGPKGPMPWMQTAHSGKRSVRLVRGGNGMNGWVVGPNGPDPELDYELRFWVFREPTGSFVVATRDGARRANETSVLVGGNGSVFLRNEVEGPGWMPTQLTIPEGKWTRLSVRVDRPRKMFGVALLSAAGEETKSSVAAPLGPVERVNSVSFYPQAPLGAACCLDDIELVERR
ncbi:MAG: HEAT repeat domain-containing protein [Lentisphaerae bacterium]|nr:HEAT repeat domain-containing protein [Lentisphaerota bacterium]MBT7054713.1 HEAT repeat domain-containing protein [Lentisphaerota bacterium]MBT7841971.1 HEAT repeat domain-containing protein [Lentisphaerota bacterium]